MILYCNLTWSALHLKTCSSAAYRQLQISKILCVGARGAEAHSTVTCFLCSRRYVLVAYACSVCPKGRACPNPVISVLILLFFFSPAFRWTCCCSKLHHGTTPSHGMHAYEYAREPPAAPPAPTPVYCRVVDANQPKIYILQKCKVLQFKEKSNRVILQVTKQIFKPEEFFRSFSCTVDSVEVKVSALLFSKL